MGKSLAAEATVFWLVVSAIVELVARPTSQTPGMATYGAIIIAILNLVIAFMCWRLKAWAFIAAIALSLLLAIVAFPESPGNEATPYGAFIDSMIIISALWVAFLGYRSFREIRTKVAQTSPKIET